MNTKIKEKILNVISLIPGIKGFVTLDFAQKAKILKKDFWEEAINIEKIGKKFLVQVAIILKNDIRGEVVPQEISSSVKKIFEEAQIPIKETIVYIRR